MASTVILFSSTIIIIILFLFPSDAEGFTVYQVEFDKDEYKVGDTPIVTVIAIDSNLDPNEIDSIQVQAQLLVDVGLGPTPLGTFEIQETGTDTGIFDGPILQISAEHLKHSSGEDNKYIQAMFGGVASALLLQSPTVTVEPTADSAIPGCEETSRGCWIPMDVTIDVGEKVTWKNTDTASHTATSGDGIDPNPGMLFDSGILANGDSFSFTFDIEGKYPYFCMLHPWMVGNVIVGDFVEPPPVDTTPPVISVPSHITKSTTNSNGMSVTYSATATDNIDGTLTPTCTPSSGSTFAIGTTTVRCSATDSSRNTGANSFTVTINETIVSKPPPETKFLLHENNQFGFSITYPSTWKITESLERDDKDPNRISLVKFGPSPLTFYGVSLIEDDAKYKGLIDENFLDKMEQEATESCSSSSEPGIKCMNVESVERDILNHVNGYKMYFSSYVFSYSTDQGTMDAILAVALIPDGDNIWELILGSFSPSELQQYSNDLKSIGESFTIFNYEGEQQKQQLTPSEPLREEISIVSTPPKILKPTDITVDAESLNGIRVSYDVLAIDETDKIIRPTCNPSSGTMFSVGTTRVTCNATDSSGNRALPVSFSITVYPPKLAIPDWVKNVASFWCEDKIGDQSFTEGIQYLINNNIIVVSASSSGFSGTSEIPNWIKNNACWWSEGLIEDTDFASGIEFLVNHGIIRV